MLEVDQDHGRARAQYHGQAKNVLVGLERRTLDGRLVRRTSDGRLVKV